MNKIGLRRILPLLAMHLMVLATTGKHVAAQDSLSGFFSKAIDQSQPKMVKVFGAGVANVEGNSTGILVSAEGHILTIHGVYLDGPSVRVVLADGSEHQATILKRNRQSQLALLKIEAATPDFFELPSQPVGDPGDWVVALTNAFKVADKNEPVSVMWGVISLRTTMEARRTKRDVAYLGELVLVDCITSNPGAGGGAIVLSDGRLVGMVGRIIDSSETNTRLNYAVPSSALAKFLTADPNQSTEVTATPEQEKKKAELGIVLFKLGGRSNPAYIDRVRPGSPASKADLKTDDMIISIGGQKIGNTKHYEEVLATLTPGQETIVVVKRGKELLRLPMIPEEKK